MRCAAVVALLLGAALVLGAAQAESAWETLKQQYLQASRAEHDARIASWREVAAWSFDTNSMPEAFHVYEGEWEVVDGELRAVAGDPDRNRTIRIADCRWPAFRLEFDVALHPREGAPPDRVGDVGIRFNADRETGGFGDGYAVITAQYANQATVFYRLNVPYARTEWSPIEPGRRHRVALEVVKPHVRLWVDGRVVLDAWERAGDNNRDHRDFLDMDPQRALVLHTYDTVMAIDNLRISVPADDD